MSGEHPPFKPQVSRTRDCELETKWIESPHPHKIPDSPTPVDPAMLHRITANRVVQTTRRRGGNHCSPRGLDQGMSSGNLANTKITPYLHRDSSGLVCQPKVLYVNSRVPESVPHSHDRGFPITFSPTRISQYCLQRSLLGLRGAGGYNKEEIYDKESAKDYGYLSYSDLGDDEDE